jgi:hypothetical protein
MASTVGFAIFTIVATASASGSPRRSDIAHPVLGAAPSLDLLLFAGRRAVLGLHLLSR